MADRYSDILRGSQLKKALDNYLKYLAGETDRQPNIGKGKARPALIALYVRPFGTALATKQFAKVSGDETFWKNNKPKFKDYTQDELLTGTPDETSLKLKGFRPARLSYKTNIGTTGTEKTSNVTKMKYLSYGGTSSSAPFGNKATSVSEGAAFEALKKEFTVNATNKVYWMREKY
jgi:hypothetical protein